jgi:hypothetical protein
MLITAVFVAIVIIGATGLALGGLLFVRRRVSMDTLTSHHEVANPMMSVVGTLYSVLLGFLVVCAFNRYDGCRVGLQAEANAVSNLFHLAMGLPAETRSKIQDDCVKYLDSVINDEFPAMAEGKSSSLTRKAIDALWVDLLTFSPKNNLQGNVHGALLTCLMATSEHRRDRIFILNPGMWPVLWGMLILGNFTIIIFTYFFGMKNVRTQMIMICLVSLMLSVNVYLVVDFSTPFSGLIEITPDVMIKQRANLVQHLNVPNED